MPAVTLVKWDGQEVVNFLRVRPRTGDIGANFWLLRIRNLARALLALLYFHALLGVFEHTLYLSSGTNWRHAALAGGFRKLVGKKLLRNHLGHFLGQIKG